MTRRDEAEDRHRRAERRRIRRVRQAALAPLMVEGLAHRDQVIRDSERYAAPLSERLDTRDRIQILLWALLLIVGAFALVSFFSAPLMDRGLAITALSVAIMLILSYLM
jgi:hypothetical protein